jgi:RHS repeat-associated protein
VDEPVAQVDYSPSAGTRYFHQDHLGTVVALTDAAGNLEDTYSYSTHGEIGEEGAEGSIWRFTGRQLDAETGLYYYRARMYSPRDGRFLQTDPAGDVDSLNLYQYALWDPIINKDPTGKFVPIIAAAASCAANPACRSSVAFAGGAVAGAIGNVATQVAAGGPVNFTEVGIAAATSGVAAVAVANGANPAAANGIAAATGSLASDVATGKVSDLQSGVAAGVKAGVMGVAGAVGGGLGAKAEDAIGVAVPTVGGRVTGSVVGSTVGETVTGIADPLATRAGVDAADVRPEAQRIQNQINHGVACQNQPQALGCQ